MVEHEDNALDGGLFYNHPSLFLPYHNSWNYESNLDVDPLGNLRANIRHRLMQLNVE